MAQQRRRLIGVRMNKGVTAVPWLGKGAYAQMDGESIAKWIILSGLALVTFGGLVWLVARAGLPLGSLPGDVRIDRPGFSLHFPIVTCIILSVVLTVLINIVMHLLRR